ncbi:retinoblastoma-related protein-like [Pyrus ussuriensis x Pyrus communis]|uniref:Retinoblastoma-related protein-like n=1 Tax=Pyrus ussuriensis x Pyrus communis TaxID=2448454 RepID=A0A5N5FPH1_9ROSA|nr:retinoblastoma-related protein-like [Pyrus ussuriensis x Pyrus communis]
MSETFDGYTEINDFFKELPQFVVKAGSILSNIYGVDWENKLRCLQAIYFATLTARAKYVWTASCFCFLRK